MSVFFFLAVAATCETSRAQSIVVVYQAVSSLPAWEAEAGEIVATSSQEWLDLVELYEGEPNFQGTILVSDGPAPGTNWPPTNAGLLHIHQRVLDVPYYRDTWLPAMDSGWTPEYLNELEVTPAPSVEASIYSLRLWQRSDETHAKNILMRVRETDGAIGVVSVQNVLAPPIFTMPQSLALAPCSGGFYWQFARLCCISQAITCRILIPRAIPGHPVACMRDRCASCVSSCFACSGGGNPCHSCDPCGFTWLYCRLFPKTSCN